VVRSFASAAALVDAAAAAALSAAALAFAATAALGRLARAAAAASAAFFLASALATASAALAAAYLQRTDSQQNSAKKRPQLGRTMQCSRTWQRPTCSARRRQHGRPAPPGCVHQQLHNAGARKKTRTCAAAKSLSDWVIGAWEKVQWGHHRSAIEYQGSSDLAHCLRCSSSSDVLCDRVSSQYNFSY